LSEHKSEETFRVIDRRLFTEEGELRQEIAEEEKREAVKEANVAKPEAPAAPAATPENPPAETPKRLAAFENLIRMIAATRRWCLALTPTRVPASP